MHCPNCGKEIPAGGTSCSSCSNASPALPEAKRRDVYIILAFFLGWLGIHSFYADRTLIAVIQMLLTVLTCGLLGPAVFLRALIEMFAVTRDGRGVALGGDITRDELYPGSPIFTCPAGDTVNNGSGFLNASNCDYIYLGGATERNPYYLILPEAPGSHRDNFVSILYSSGTIAGKKQPSSVTDIRKLLKELEKKSSPECIEFLRKKQKLF